MQALEGSATDQEMARHIEQAQAAVDRAGVPDQTYVSLTVYETFESVSGRAVPLSRDVFNAPGDRRVSFTSSGEARDVKKRDHRAVLDDLTSISEDDD